MANIKITVEGPLMDGHKVTFKAPCNCDVVEKLDVRYIENDTQKSKLFTMKDAHGNDLTGLGNLFYKNAYVDVVLDPNSGSAYLQNAGTNKYLEQKTTPVDNFESDRSDLPASARTVKVLNESLEWKYIGTVQGANTFSHDFMKYNELWLICTLRYSGDRTVNVPTTFFNNVTSSVIVVTEGSGSLGISYMTLAITANSLKITNAITNNTDVMAESYIHVYAR